MVALVILWSQPWSDLDILFLYLVSAGIAAPTLYRNRSWIISRFKHQLCVFGLSICLLTYSGLFAFGSHSFEVRHSNELMGDSKAYIGYMEEHIQADPNAAVLINNLAWYLIAQAPTTDRDPGRALELAKLAASLDPTALAYQDTLGCAYAARGDYPSALQVASEHHIDSRLKQFSEGKPCQ